MAEFTLPQNSKVKKGKSVPLSSEAGNTKKFIVYRYDPAIDENPTFDTFEIDLDKCGPMVLDALIEINQQQIHRYHSVVHAGKAFVDPVLLTSTGLMAWPARKISMI